MPGHPGVVRYSSFATIVRDGEYPEPISSAVGCRLPQVSGRKPAEKDMDGVSCLHQIAVFQGGSGVSVSDLSASAGMLSIASAWSLWVLW
jgi:hypothetical protein